MSDHDLDELSPRLDGDGLASARDMLELLWCRLRPRDRAILVFLLEGRGVREIARLLRISHPTVIEHRQVIAAVARRLGIEGWPRPGRTGARRYLGRRRSVGCLSR